MKKWEELTEKQKLQRTKWAGRGIGFVAGMLFLTLLHLILKARGKK